MPERKKEPRARGTKSDREGAVRRPGDGSLERSNPSAGKHPDTGKLADTGEPRRRRSAGPTRKRGERQAGGPGQTGRAAHGPQDEGPVLKSGPAQEHRKLTPGGRKRGEQQGQGGWAEQAGKPKAKANIRVR